MSLIDDAHQRPVCPYGMNLISGSHGIVSSGEIDLSSRWERELEYVTRQITALAQHPTPWNGLQHRIVKIKPPVRAHCFPGRISSKQEIIPYPVWTAVADVRLPLLLALLDSVVRMSLWRHNVPFARFSQMCTYLVTLPWNPLSEEHTLWVFMARHRFSTVQSNIAWAGTDAKNPSETLIVMDDFRDIWAGSNIWTIVVCYLSHKL